MTSHHQKALVTLLALLLSILAALAVDAHALLYVSNITVDRTLNRHPISPYIYGTAWCDPATLSDLNCPANRMGGDDTPTYNWQLNAHNTCFNWYFESELGLTSGSTADADNYVSQSKAGGAQPLLTIPMLDWVAKLGANQGELCSFSLAKYTPLYGPQTGSDGDAGNGILVNGNWPTPPVYLTGNDPNDAYVPNTSTFQAGWVQHLITTWGLAAAGGVRYYCLDNEPAFWYNAHWDVHPNGATMDEMLSRITAYSKAIKALDPGALIVAPEESGWDSWLYSGADQQYYSLHGQQNNGYPDQNAHGGDYYLPWLLSSLQTASKAAGQRLLDVFSMHYYPSHNEYPGNLVDDTTKLLRNQSTRSLWDPNYVDVTTGTVIALIPSMKNAINWNYPGTLTAVTEYNWGAEPDINGATAQADVLGIFGREGLDMANRWMTPDPSTPTYKAIKMYRNYDGAKSTFGETSVSATTPYPDTVSAFAAQRSKDGALTIMVVNKSLPEPNRVTMYLSNFPKSGKASVWQLTATNTITRLPDITFTGGSLTATAVPTQSITLFVVKPTAGVGPVLELLLN